MTKSSRNKHKERRCNKTFQQNVFLISSKLIKGLVIHDLEITTK